MIVVTKKDSRESVENLLRRFNRKVQQSGVLAVAKNNQFHQKPISKPDRRRGAIISAQRRAAKFKKLKLGY